MSTTAGRIPKWKILGITDDRTTCDCCGRCNLKRTVALMPLDADGNEDGGAESVDYYGTSCAATALGWTQKRVTDAARGAMSGQSERDAHAREIVTLCAPLESAPTGERARAYRELNPHARRTEAEAAESLAHMLARARTTLADATVGAARPWRLADFHRYLVITSDTGHVSDAAPLPAEAAEQKRLFSWARNRARSRRGEVWTVAALDGESARAVVQAGGTVLAWNVKFVEAR